MNKVCGNISDFSISREDESRYVISYDLQDAPNNLYTWYEIYFYKKQVGKPTFKMIKEAVYNDINSQTDHKILTGFVWNNIHVYLSIENQRNFSEAYHMAQSSSSILPITFKLGENEDGEPVYHTFSTSYELSDFYTKAFAYINQCLNEGWQRKDAIDWEPYKALYPEQEDIN